MFLKSAFIVICATCLVVRGDYCDKSLCPKGKHHIGCHNSGDLSSDCPDDAEIIDINSELQQLLIDAHNEKRNIVAGGEVDHLNAACRMATISWDDELAVLADLNVKQCRSHHDECHNTKQFKYAGQSLGWEGSSAPYEDSQLPDLLHDMVNMWYNEVENANQSQIDKYPNNYNGPTIGHFTVLVNQRNIRLGCAAVKYSGGGWYNFLTACNYATTNMIGEPVYESCDTPGEQCETGPNPDYENLCSEDEPIDPNDWS